MEVDFRHVLPGVAPGRAHEDRHTFVQGFPLILNMAVIHFMAFPGVLRGKQARQQRFRSGPAHPDNGDSPFSLGCGQGGNGVVLLHKRASFPV